METPRGFTLSDAIVLVTATAAGFAVFKSYYAFTYVYWGPPFGAAARLLGWINGLWSCLILASPFVMAWTLAILGLRLRRPRPRWRRLVRQPGFVAGSVAGLVLAFRLAGFATLRWRVGSDPGLALWSVRFIWPRGYIVAGNPGYLAFDNDHFLGTMAMIGLAVAATWMLMILSGRWKPERSWVDRAGRLLGWLWIVTLPLTAWWDFHTRFPVM
jgi:hypothetical protein